jgi:hypothetical protein
MLCHVQTAARSANDFRRKSEANSDDWIRSRFIFAFVSASDAQLANEKQTSDVRVLQIRVMRTFNELFDSSLASESQYSICITQVYIDQKIAVKMAYV